MKLCTHIIKYQRASTLFDAATQAHSSKGKSLQCFSLTELLMVMGIFSLLAALLSPSLKKVIDKADSTACASNVRQQLAGIAIYHGDHDDRFWDIRVGNTRLAEEDIQHVLYNAVKYYENKNLKESVILPTATTWSSYKPMLAEYGGGLEIFKCPSFESHSSVSDPLFDEFRYAFALSKAYDGFYMSQFMKSPSQLGAIVDAHNHKSYGVSGPNHIEVLSRAGQIMARHTDRTNFGYLDGHLELTPFEVFIPNEVQEELLGFRSDLSAKTSSWNHQNGPPKHSEYYK